MGWTGAVPGSCPAGSAAADLYHCNSIDVDPAASNPSTADVLVSMRTADAVVLINRANAQTPDGKIIWKLGGSPSNQDGAQILRIQGDPETSIYGQHDARFQPGGDISIFDNHYGQVGAARGVEYNINRTIDTATLVTQFLSPEGLSADATGSFRRYDNGADNVIGWGFKPGIDMSEVDASGRDLFDLTMDATTYRFIKVPLAAIDVNLLRQTAGITPPPPGPVNIPETPVASLLPLTGLAVLGGTIGLNRRRRRGQSVQ